MRIGLLLKTALALTLLAPRFWAADPRLSAQDESQIWAAIEAEAKKENQGPSDRIWSERGPVVYAIKKMEALSDDVATVDAVGSRTGAFPTVQNYLFIVKRIGGVWTIVRKVAESPRGGVQLISPDR